MLSDYKNSPRTDSAINL